MAETFFPNLILNRDPDNLNVVNVIGTNAYNESGLAPNDIIQYDGTNWINTPTSALGIGCFGSVGSGSQACLFSSNIQSTLANNASSTSNIAQFTGLPQTNAWLMEVEITRFYDDGVSVRESSYTSFTVFHKEGVDTVTVFQGKRHSTDKTVTPFVNTSDITYGTGTLEFLQSGGTGASSPYYNVKAVYVSASTNTQPTAFTMNGA